MATLAKTSVDGVKVLRLIGNLSQDGVEQISSEFTEQLDGSASVVVDLAGVEMIYTPGIALLLAAHGKLRKAGGRLLITGVNGPVNEVLHCCRLDRVLNMVPSSKDAIQQARHP